MNKDILLIWDFDDTIVKTNVEFEKTNVETAKVIANALYGEEKNMEMILTYQRKIDVDMIAVYGFVPQRYILSWTNTYKHFARFEGKRLSETVLTKVKNTVNDVYIRKYENIPEAIPILTRLKEEDYPMMILTAGVESIQKRKIEEAGVRGFMNDIQVRTDKTPEVLRAIVEQYPGYECVMIGNSLKSDIYPALTNGIYGFHVERKTWAADELDINTEHPKYVHLHSLSEIPEKLEFIQNQLTLPA